MSLLYLRDSGERDNQGHKFEIYLCELCGNEKKTRRSSAKKALSCGCKKRKPISHGMTGTATYKAWSNAKERCYLKSHKNYDIYGGRGIKMCGEWLSSFENFYNDIGEKPSGMTLERKDTNKGYSKYNCVWATLSSQLRNRRDSYIWVVNGIEFTASIDAEKHFSVCRATIKKWTTGICSNGNHSKPKDGCFRYRKYQ